MEKVIEIENLGKSYHLGEFGTRSLWQDINQGLKLKKGSKGLKHALRDINLSVNKGEVLGIIGANGAGKSTLLKLLSQVTGPTEGVIRTKGTIASMLEVGTGMHPELTGKENVFLNGAILGMDKAEIHKKFQAIVDFSECGEYIDTPIKRYSSGMKVRLGFAVAAFLEPDIIIIDEVLAVGDAAFQTKALKKILDIASGGKRTVLFVSHNMAAIKSLCNRCIVLKSGQVSFDGNTDKAIGHYLGYDISNVGRNRKWSREEAPGNKAVKLMSANADPPDKTADDVLTTDDALELNFKIQNLARTRELDCTLQLFSESGEFLAATSTIQSSSLDRNKGKTKFEAGQLVQFSTSIPGGIFNQGNYRLNLLVLEEGKSVLFRFDDLLQLSFTSSERKEGTWMGQPDSHFLPVLDWELRSLD